MITLTEINCPKIKSVRKLKMFKLMFVLLYGENFGNREIFNIFHIIIIF